MGTNVVPRYQQLLDEKDCRTVDALGSSLSKVHLHSSTDGLMIQNKK
jgi:hypothetical protein